MGGCLPPAYAVWGALGLPKLDGLGTESSLSEHKKEMSSGRRKYMGREFGHMPGTKARLGKFLRRSGLGCKRQREQLDSESCSLGMTTPPPSSQSAHCMDLHKRSPGRLCCYLPHYTHGGN